MIKILKKIKSGLAAISGWIVAGLIALLAFFISRDKKNKLKEEIEAENVEGMKASHDQGIEDRESKYKEMIKKHDEENENAGQDINVDVDDPVGYVKDFLSRRNNP